MLSNMDSPHTNVSHDSFEKETTQLQKDSKEYIDALRSL